MKIIYGVWLSLKGYTQYLDINIDIREDKTYFFIQPPNTLEKIYYSPIIMRNYINIYIFF